MGNEDKLVREFDLVLRHVSPLLGICYGCQILVRAFGATLAPLLNPVHQQIVTIRTTPEGAALLGDRDIFEYNVYASRKNCIDIIPNAFIVVAESEYGPEILVHRTKPFVGVMFHPEHVATDNQGAELVQKIFKNIAKQ